MKKFSFDAKVYLLIFLLPLALLLLKGHTLAAFSISNELPYTVVIDAGHGGMDGGAVSCTGEYESKINLEIALKLNDLMHLVGIRTVMIRDTDRSVYTDGKTIAAQKVSDIRQRVKIINTTPNAILISIHQNYFEDGRYSGAQVFYNNAEKSKLFAEEVQTALRTNINPQNKRQTKKAKGIYLMNHINCPGILVECGFLSNREEERLLRDNEYQNKFCCTVVSTVSQYLNT